MRFVWGIAAHGTVVLALSFAAFLVLDWFNPLMGFTSNEVSTPLLAAFCILALATSVRLIVLERRCAAETRGREIFTRGGSRRRVPAHPAPHRRAPRGGARR